MAAIARVLARAFPSMSAGNQEVATIALLCALGLLASLLFMIVGNEFSSGFF
jgi:hypothetical protein